MRKYILHEGQLILGNVEFHRELVPDHNAHTEGGGLWDYDPEQKILYLYGVSSDYGGIMRERLIEVLPTSTFSMSYEGSEVHHSYTLKNEGDVEWTHIYNIDSKKSRFGMIHNEQTPAVPEMSIDELLKHKKVLLDFKDHASKSYSTGLAVAANQVGIYNDANELERFMLPAIAKRMGKPGESDIWQLILNPKITKRSGLKEEKLEYCLTWPGKKILADRDYVIEVEYYDMNGKQHTLEAKGFEAQIWQHEINHLEGIPEVVVKSGGGMEHSRKIGRNEPCPCGSGKKYKKCCL